MPTYKGKELSELSDWDLAIAQKELSKQRDNFLEKLNHPRLQRLKPPPEMNPSFITLLAAIDIELGKRNNE